MNHSTVNYVWEYPPVYLASFHLLVINEMKLRGYNPDEKWLDYIYRGKNCKPWSEEELNGGKDCIVIGSIIYPEHNDEYLKECIDNLKGKGIRITENFP